MKYILLLLLIGFSSALFAQGSTTAIEKRAVSEQQWERAAGGLDYSKDVPKAEKKKPAKQPSTSSFPNIDTKFWGSFFQFLAILIAVIAIGYGVYRMLQEPRNKRIARDGAEITVDNLENYLHETDLDRFLKEALGRQEFAQAIRIYYLQIIKQLSESGAINWSKEKTNRDYLREMRTHAQFDPFRDLTRSYERVWYGNISLDATRFAELEPGFLTFRASVAAQ